MDILYQLEQMSPGIILAFSTTHTNPNARMKAIQQNLDSSFNGIIVFDLLLCINGGSTRFLQVSARKGMIDSQTTKLMEASQIRKKILAYANNFYRSNSHILPVNDLSNEEKHRLMFV